MNQSSVTNRDVKAQIARLFVYPVKSCAGIEVQEAMLTDTGLHLDRAWMIVDAQGVFVTQREHPRLALVHPHLFNDELVLKTPGMRDLHIGFDVPRRPLSVKIWDDEIPAFDMGDEAALWFTEYLAMPGMPACSAVTGPIDLRGLIPRTGVYPVCNGQKVFSP